MQDGKRLTVGELIEQLGKEDKNALVAFETSHAGKTVLADTTWQAGTFYMKKAPRIQDEYLMEDEVPADKQGDYVKVLVMGTAAKVGE